MDHLIPRTRVAPNILIIVPYRAGPGQEDREAQLRVFVSFMPPFLERAGLDAHIVVVKQKGRQRFNRGALLNAGYLWTREHLPEYAKHAICFHDVDLLPANTAGMRQAYKMYVHLGAFHIARCWRRYDTDQYLGGVLTVDTRTFEAVNGYPNMFWGWGGEDDELRDRLHSIGAPVERFVNGQLYDAENLELAQKLDKLRTTKEKCMNKWEVREFYTNARRRGGTGEGLAELGWSIAAHVTTGTTTHLDVDLLEPSEDVTWERCTKQTF